MNAKVKELRDNLTRKIIESIEAGAPAWRKPWNLGPNAGAPCSGRTGARYRGGNALILGFVAREMGYSSKYWNTFKNWKLAGASVRPGQHGTTCQYINTSRKEVENEDGERTLKNMFIWRCFWLFNAEQVRFDDAADGAKFLVPENTFEHDNTIDYSCFDRMVKSKGIKLRHGGDSAFFHPHANYINMPKKGHFKTLADYYATLAHECIHWQQSKLNGGTEGPPQAWGDDQYAKNELEAELGSMFLLQSLGLPHGTPEQEANHAGYLKSWLKKFKDDNSYIFAAATAASKWVDRLNPEKVAEAVEV